MRELQQGLGRNVEVFKMNRPGARNRRGGRPGSHGAVFVRDLNAPPVLTNFRAREFAYSPQVKELYRGLRALLPYALILIGVALLVLTTNNSVRERRISVLENTIRKEIGRPSRS